MDAKGQGHGDVSALTPGSHPDSIHHPSVQSVRKRGRTERRDKVKARERLLL